MPRGLDLSDVQFANAAGPSYDVLLMDHTGLGGPMGSEHTSLIQSWTFGTNIGIVKAFAKLLIERAAGPSVEGQASAARDVANLFKQIDTEFDAFLADNKHTFNVGVDLGAYGVYVRTNPTALISNFWFDRPVMSVQRVDASVESIGPLLSEVQS